MKVIQFTKTNEDYSYKPFELPVIIDTNTIDVNPLKPCPSGLFDTYLAPEDCEIRYKDGNETKVIKAEKGDIIFCAIKADWIKNKIFVVKNRQWKQNIAEYMVKEEMRKSEDEIRAKVISDIPQCESCKCKCSL